jgi:hypothetical protein
MIATAAMAGEIGMAKRSGRKRKIGDREPNGRAQRSYGPDRGTGEREAQAVRLLGEARPGVDLDDALAVLAHLGHITNEQAAAGTDWGRAHHALYGEPWVNCGEKPPGRSLSLDDRSRLEAKVARAQSVVSAVGGNAVTICRSVCIASILPIWAIERPVVTINKQGVKFARDRDRQQMRAMKRDLPALKRGLDELIRARFGGALAMERAA